MLRVAINGFGRIGRVAFRAGFERKDIEFVAINDLTEPATLAHLLKYDSTFRTWAHDVKAGKDHLIINGKKIPVLTAMDPALLPWKELKVDVVIESTGRFTKKADAEKHILAGAKRVVISAPSEDAPTFLIGVNHKLCKKTDTVVSNASCTTNSAAPVVQILTETLGIKKAMLTTIHSVTMEQNLIDGLPPKMHPDLRRARSALINIVPTSTGAAKATTEVVPSLKGKFDGIAIRVPSIDVSLTDFTFVVGKNTSKEEINKIFKDAAKSARYGAVCWKTKINVNADTCIALFL